MSFHTKNVLYCDTSPTHHTLLFFSHCVAIRHFIMIFTQPHNNMAIVFSCHCSYYASYFHINQRYRCLMVWNNLSDDVHSGSTLK